MTKPITPIKRNGKKPIYSYWPHIVVLVLIAVGSTDPAKISEKLLFVSRSFMHYGSWFVLLSCSVFLVSAFYLGLSRFGSIRLGTDDERPRYSTLSWISMLFASGMGSGLVFYGATEPLIHFYSPPPDSVYNAESARAARQAMVITNFHWAFHAWAIYCICALSIAYFSFRKRQPPLPSSPMVGRSHIKQGGIAEEIINGLALLTVVSGLVGTLANGSMNVKGGFEGIFDVNLSDNTMFVIIVLLLTTAYLISASTKISQGIKVLSNVNIIISIILMCFILFAGPTLFIMKTSIYGLGDYLAQIVPLSFNVRLYGETEKWMQKWTLSFLLWWVAWGPFVGVFIARISRGRTIKEFVLGVMLVPSIFSMFWFSVFGGAGLHLELFEGKNIAEYAANHPHDTTYKLLSYLPFSEITHIVAFTLMFIFLITSADTGSYVLGMFSSSGNPNPPRSQRIFWGLVLGTLALGALLSGKGLILTQTIASFGALPFLFIMIWQTMCLFKSIREEKIPLHHYFEVPENIESEQGQENEKNNKD